MPSQNIKSELLKEFYPAPDRSACFYSLPELSRKIENVKSLPISLRIILESLLRQEDGCKVTRQHIEELANWKPHASRSEEIPFTVARVVLQDFTGIPLLVDLAAMRSAAAKIGKSPDKIEPIVPVDLVVDHSVMIDYFRRPDALDLNMKLEFQRNQERYKFIKWGMQAFKTFKVVPPGIGIVHQVNLEHLANGIHEKDGVCYPDTLVGTDSHTTMINGIGVVGWGVGGIEAEAAMLGQPVYILTPDVVGVKLTGSLMAGCTATDLVLTITEILRKEKVVGKFVEFFGEGTSSLTVPDRATIANMAPEYGATLSFFPIDEQTVAYFKGTGRTEEQIHAFTQYFKAQELFGVPKDGSIQYSRTLSLDLSQINPSLSGPKRPQDRMDVGQAKQVFYELFSKPMSENGFSKNPDALKQTFPTKSGIQLKHGDILIAAITSCTNTSNPSVLLAAGLLAKKAIALGLHVASHIKTSLAPGSRVVTEYLKESGLLESLELLGFNVAAYGCTTCIGNSGDLIKEFNDVIIDNDLICSAVLSGNRNFEARIHPNIRANFLTSPPLVVAYAIAGTICIDLTKDPLGLDAKGSPIFLRDIWPAAEEIQTLIPYAMNPETFKRLYEDLTKDHHLWNKIETYEGTTYKFSDSSYIAEPPFFDGFALTPAASERQIKNARALCLFGDSITTDHISPAGAITPNSPAGRYLIEKGIQISDFNSYGARRGHHEVMMRGTFANIRIKNFIVPKKPDGNQEEGGITIHQPSLEKMSIYDAAMRYMEEKVPTIIFAGEEYGTGSSRDWAAKGTQLLGIKAVVAKSFERIHRSNLAGMGVLPLQFAQEDSWQSLKISLEDRIDIEIPKNITPREKILMTIHRLDGTVRSVELISRIDTLTEVSYYEQGGILPYVLRKILA